MKKQKVDEIFEQLRFSKFDDEKSLIYELNSQECDDFQQHINLIDEIEKELKHTELAKSKIATYLIYFFTFLVGKEITEENLKEKVENQDAKALLTLFFNLFNRTIKTEKLRSDWHKLNSLISEYHKRECQDSLMTIVLSPIFLKHMPHLLKRV